MIVTIARNEIRRMFCSPLAWAILAIVLFILAFFFLIYINNFSELQTQFTGRTNVPGVSDAIAAPLLLWAAVIMLAVMPLLTMRSFSEERQSGSLTLLTSAPLSITEIVLGKYLGLLMFITIMLALIALMPLSLAGGTSLDFGKVLAGLLGLFLLLASFAAAGLYLSSLTATPLVAAAGSFGLLLFLVVLYISGNSQAAGSELFIYLSHFGHFLSFLEGLFDSSDLVYYLLFIGGFLALTVHHLDNRRLLR